MSSNDIRSLLSRVGLRQGGQGLAGMMHLLEASNTKACGVLTGSPCTKWHQCWRKGQMGRSEGHTSDTFEADVCLT